MESETTGLNRRTPAKIALQFLIGLAIGSAIILIPISYFNFFTPGISSIQIAASAGFVLVCGLLSAIWGNKGLEILVKIIESMSF
jgi:hypothetical protein